MRRAPWATVAAALLLSAAAGAEAASCDAAASCSQGPDDWGAAEAEPELMQAELLQTRGQILRSRGGGQGARQPAGGGSGRSAVLLRSQAGAGLTAEERAGLLVPLAWFHVAKTGTSIVNTFYHTPALCPAFPVDDYISETGEGTDDQVNEWKAYWGDREEVCAGAFSDSYALGDQSSYWAPNAWDRAKYDIYQLGHTGIGGLTGELYQLNRGHFVAMFRQPEQRLISAYNYFGAVPVYTWSSPLKATRWPYNTESPSLGEYAEVSAGCTVRQLTLNAVSPCEFAALPTSEDVSDAITMLHEGFAFVGITEQWALSVCLFRAMFGGQCVDSDFADARPTDNSSDSISYYDTEELHGWVDVLDGPLFAEATLIFDATRSVYGVDSHSCTSFCKGQFD